MRVGRAFLCEIFFAAFLRTARFRVCLPRSDLFLCGGCSRRSRDGTRSCAGFAHSVTEHVTLSFAGSVLSVVEYVTIFCARCVFTAFSSMSLFSEVFFLACWSRSPFLVRCMFTAFSIMSRFSVLDLFTAVSSVILFCAGFVQSVPECVTLFCAGSFLSFLERVTLFFCASASRYFHSVLQYVFFCAEYVQCVPVCHFFLCGALSHSQPICATFHFSLRLSRCSMFACVFRLLEQLPPQSQFRLSRRFFLQLPSFAPDLSRHVLGVPRLVEDRRQLLSVGWRPIRRGRSLTRCSASLFRSYAWPRVSSQFVSRIDEVLRTFPAVGRRGAGQPEPLMK